MIYIFFTRIDKRLEENVYQQLLQQLPAVCQERINRLRRWQDAQRSLLGLDLLKSGLIAIDKDPSLIYSITYQANGKPILDSSITFNISHAGQYSVCVVSTDETVGIDIEELVDRPLDDFRSQFTKQEWSNITSCKDGLRLFYTYWTKKESLVKATGNGLSTDVSKIDTRHDMTFLEGTQWHWCQLPIHTNYIAHLACSTNNPKLYIKECLII